MSGGGGLNAGQMAAAGLGALGGWALVGGSSSVFVGASLGWMLYDRFFPQEDGDGGKSPEELRYDHYEHGRVVPIVYGTDKIDGTIIWLDNVSTVTKTTYTDDGSDNSWGSGLVSALGSGDDEDKNKQEQVVYKADFAFSMGEGNFKTIYRLLINESEIADWEYSLSWAFYDGRQTLTEYWSGTGDTSTFVYNALDYYNPISAGGDQSSEVHQQLQDLGLTFKHTSYLFFSGEVGTYGTLPTLAMEARGIDPWPISRSIKMGTLYEQMMAVIYALPGYKFSAMDVKYGDRDAHYCAYMSPYFIGFGDPTFSKGYYVFTWDGSIWSYDPKTDIFQKEIEAGVVATGTPDAHPWAFWGGPDGYNILWRRDERTHTDDNTGGRGRKLYVFVGHPYRVYDLFYMDMETNECVSLVKGAQLPEGVGNTCVANIFWGMPDYPYEAYDNQGRSPYMKTFESIIWFSMEIMNGKAYMFGMTTQWPNWYNNYLTQQVEYFTDHLVSFHITSRGHYAFEDVSIWWLDTNYIVDYLGENSNTVQQWYWSIYPWGTGPPVHWEYAYSPFSGDLSLSGAIVGRNNLVHQNKLVLSIDLLTGEYNHDCTYRTPNTGTSTGDFDDYTGSYLASLTSWQALQGPGEYHGPAPDRLPEFLESGTWKAADGWSMAMTCRAGNYIRASYMTMAFVPWGDFKTDYSNLLYPSVQAEHQRVLVDADVVRWNSPDFNRKEFAPAEVTIEGWTDSTSNDWSSNTKDNPYGLLTTDQWVAGGCKKDDWSRYADDRNTDFYNSATRSQFLECKEDCYNDGRAVCGGARDCADLDMSDPCGCIPTCNRAAVVEEPPAPLTYPVTDCFQPPIKVCLDNGKIKYYYLHYHYDWSGDQTSVSYSAKQGNGCADASGFQPGDVNWIEPDAVTVVTADQLVLSENLTGRMADCVKQYGSDKRKIYLKRCDEDGTGEEVVFSFDFINTNFSPEHDVLDHISNNHLYKAATRSEAVSMAFWCGRIYFAVYTRRFDSSKVSPTTQLFEFDPNVADSSYRPRLIAWLWCNHCLANFIETRSHLWYGDIGTDIYQITSPESVYDVNPIWAIYDFLTNSRYGMGLDPKMIDGGFETYDDFHDNFIASRITLADLQTAVGNGEYGADADFWDKVDTGEINYGTWIIAKYKEVNGGLVDGFGEGTSFKRCYDYCEELVSVADYPEDQKYDLCSWTCEEKRYSASFSFNYRQKGYDILKEMMATCNAFLYYCEGKLCVGMRDLWAEPDIISYFGTDQLVGGVSK